MPSPIADLIKEQSVEDYKRGLRRALEILDECVDWEMFIGKESNQGVLAIHRAIKIVGDELDK